MTEITHSGIKPVISENIYQKNVEILGTEKIYSNTFGNLNACNPAGLDHILGQSPPRVI